MTDEQARPPDADDWAAFAAHVNESFLAGLQKNIEAQAEFVEAWTETLEDGLESPAASEETLDSYARAQQIWMDAVEEQYTEFLSGAEPSATEARDRWLETANEAFKEVMSTSAFAAATGHTVEQALEAQREASEAAEETLQALGFATRADVREVGDRLVELERRQHDVEERLDRILEELAE